MSAVPDFIFKHNPSIARDLQAPQLCQCPERVAAIRSNDVHLLGHGGPGLRVGCCTWKLASHDVDVRRCDDILYLNDLVTKTWQEQWLYELLLYHKDNTWSIMLI